MHPKLKALIIALIIVTAFNLFEQVISGDGVAWFLAIEKPPILVSIEVFYLVAVLYACMCVLVLMRLIYGHHKEPNKKYFHAILWLSLLLLANCLWNYAFMGLQNPFYGFLGMLAFVPIVLVNVLNLYRLDFLSFFLMLIYAIWVGYDLIWTYALWQMHV